MKQEPLVSVVMITYNHEKYIRQAIDSVLMQKTDFSIELLIGDDASIDGTAQIVREYEEKYPDVIRAKLRNENVGGTRNSYDLFISAKGKYIAVLEGDDYWTDKNKLQKQVDFLENNPIYAGCGCEFTYVDNEGIPYPKENVAALRHNLYCDKEDYTLDDFNASKLPSHAGTMLFKNIFASGLDTTILYKAHPMIGDCTVILLVVSQGKIKKMQEEMSAYRLVQKKSSSFSSSEMNNPFLCYMSFSYYTKLEDYARKYLNIHVDLGNVKQRFFYDGVCVYNDFSSEARRESIRRMLRMTRHKTRYIRILIERFISAAPQTTLRNALKAEEYKDHMQASWEAFESVCKGKKVILVGAGGGCREFFEQYYYKYQVDFIVDNALELQGGYLCGKKIYSFSKLNEIEGNKAVAIITPGGNIDSLIEQCKQYGIKNCFSYIRMECMKQKYMPFKWLVNHRIYLKNI